MARLTDRPQGEERVVLEAELLPPAHAGTTALSRREVLGWSSGLFATSVLAGLPEAAHAAALPPPRAPRPLPRVTPDLSQIQYPFWAGDWNLPSHYETIRFADFDGSGKQSLFGHQLTRAARRRGRRGRR